MVRGKIVMLLGGCDCMYLDGEVVGYGTKSVETGTYEKYVSVKDVTSERAKALGFEVEVRTFNAGDIPVMVPWPDTLEKFEAAVAKHKEAKKADEVKKLRERLKFTLQDLKARGVDLVAELAETRKKLVEAEDLVRVFNKAIEAMNPASKLAEKPAEPVKAPEPLVSLFVTEKYGHFVGEIKCRPPATGERVEDVHFTPHTAYTTDGYKRHFRDYAAALKDGKSVAGYETTIEDCKLYVTFNGKRYSILRFVVTEKDGKHTASFVWG